ncbi:hypothetical protein, partial [Enterococcus sp. C76]
MSLTRSLTKNKVLKKELWIARANGNVEKGKVLSFEDRTDVACTSYSLSNEVLGGFSCLVEGNRVMRFPHGTQVEMVNPRLVEINVSYRDSNDEFVNYTERV